VKVTSKGQVTIPRDLRELAGIEPGSEVIFAIEDHKITITPKHAKQDAEMQARMEKALEHLGKMRGTGDQSLKAGDVMRMTRDRGES
jgi:AbrB family looped-hinge helix DNA binding protein